MNIILGFDNDAAGQAATERAQELIQQFFESPIHHIEQINEDLFLGKYTRFNAEEMYICEEVEKAHKPIRMTDRELFETFGKDGVQIAKENIKRLEEEVKEINERSLQYLIELYKKNYQISFKDLMADVARNTSGAQVKEREDHIKRLNRFISASKPSREGTITDSDIQAAREVPIEDYMEFNKSGFARCPFHGERTPSMKLYRDKNRVHCFGACAKGFDVIDIVMHQNEIPFLEAVKLILNK